MLLDTKAGLHLLHDRLTAFLHSSAAFAEFGAATDLSPEPYEKFLPGLRLRKTQGATRLTVGKDGWLELEGSQAALNDCIRKLLVKEEDGHIHLYTAPVSLIIQSDSKWEAEIAS